MGVMPKLSAAFQNISSTPVLKTQTRPKRSATNLILIFITLTTVLLFSLPHTTTYLTTLRYPRCGHIVLVSSQRHGSTWFISNAEGCTSTNGSFGPLIKLVEIWNHGKVKNITLDDAIDLVRFNTSVKIFPEALYNERENVKAFFEAMRDMEIPVFVLRRELERSFASLQAAWKSKVWSADHGGNVVEREFKPAKKFRSYKNKTETFFDDVKTLMRDVDIPWDELHYEKILSDRLILGANSKCYVRNCNF